MATKKLRILSTNLQSVVLPANIQRGLGTIDALKLKPEVVLSENNRKSCIDRFKLYKATKKLEGDVNQAAVLIPFCIHRGELGLLYTLRSSKLNSNRGQVSFPGGMHDKSDRDLEETALRETWEELKIPKEKVDVWTRGNFIRGKSMNIMPVLGYIGEVEPEKLEINADEVEEAFVVPLNTLCEPSLCRFTQFRDSYTLPTYLGGKHRIWGLTAAITHIAMSALLPEVYKHKPVYLKPILRGRLPAEVLTTVIATTLIPGIWKIMLICVDAVLVFQLCVINKSATIHGLIMNPNIGIANQ